jgi:hypothetical protein
MQKSCNLRGEDFSAHYKDVFLHFQAFFHHISPPPPNPRHILSPTCIFIHLYSSRQTSKLACVICLFVECFEPHEQFLSYLTAVTITGDRAANLDLHVASKDFTI